MKKIILIVFLLAGFTSKAQYFQHLYGHDPEIGTVVRTGMNTNSTGPGHLIGGMHMKDLLSSFPPPSINGELFALHVIRTDADGRFTTPNEFNNTYRLLNSNNDVIRFTAGAVTEFSDGSGYAALGTYFYDEYYPQAAGVAYIRLDLNGNVMTTKGYTLSPMIEGGAGINIAAVRESVSTPGDIFATGDNWVLRIDQNGTLIWGNVYSGAPIINKDLIESPYAPELIVVGQLVNSPIKGLWMKLDPNTGAVVQADEMSSYFATNEYLHSIDVSNDPLLQGFILSGVADEKVWVVRTDQAGNYVWSGIYQPSTPVNYIYGRDAVGRLIKSDDGNRDDYEYYVTGPLKFTSGVEDAFIFKIDRWGQPKNPNGLFVYGYINGSGIGIEETGLDIDVNTSGTADGVTMYAVGEDNSATKEVYVVKAYFNGFSGCNEYFEDIHSSIAEFFPSNSLSISATAMGTETLTLYNIESELDNELCHNTTIMGGDNSLVAPTQQGDKEAKISPNPIAQGAQYAAIEVEIETPTTAQISVYDMLGRKYYSQTYTLVKGKNNLVLDISNINMAQGMYTVKIQGENLNKNIMLLVK